MKLVLHIPSIFILCLFLVIGTNAKSQEIEKEIDAIVSSMYSKAITKQFTSVAILMLAEQGKLNIHDEITKYIPDYPTQGKKITIHHLLNHTSGIKSYTSMNSFLELTRKDMKPKELIDVFKNEPMDFSPGTEYRYNNSGYILLGYIIEVITDDTYENFIEKNIFEKIEMNSSYYGSMKELIKNRASGYQLEGDDYVNSNYLSLTLPYAAGSIMSTVDDLLKWQNAIRENTLIKRSSLEKAINGSKLDNGKRINYGYGWSKTEIQESKGYAHGGATLGFLSNGIFLEKEHVYVIGLTNCTCKNVKRITEKVAAVVIGKPIPDKKDAITLSLDALKKWEGAYQFDNDVIRHITVENGKIFSQNEKKNAKKLEIYPMKDGSFIFDNGTTSYNFSITDDGKRQTVFRKSGKDFIGKGIKKAAPVARKTITVAPKILQQYVGKYELQPNFFISITVQGNSIYAQATQQPKMEIFAETTELK